MNAQDAIKLSIDTGEMMTMAYIGDLSDADLLIRPVPGCNHINWQIGHLIVAEHGILSKLARSGAAAARRLCGKVHEGNSHRRRSESILQQRRIAARQTATARRPAGLSQADHGRGSRQAQRPEWAPTVAAASLPPAGATG